MTELISYVQDECNNFQRMFSGDNMLQSDMLETYRNIPSFGTISINTFKPTSIRNDSTIQKCLIEIVEPKMPYPNIEDIRELQIKNEDYFTNGEKIKIYSDFDDNKFSKCNNCKIRKNEFFCQKCQKNICSFCNENCKNKNHNLLNLKCLFENYINYKNKINGIFYKCFIENSKKRNHLNGDIIKREKIYNLNYYDFPMCEEFNGKKSFPDTNDIRFISIMKEKDYINYFHFVNIKRCYKYLKNRYENAFDNDCLKIECKLKTLQRKNIRIFSDVFVKNNKDKISLIINNKKSELVTKTNIKGNDLEIILVQKLKDGEKNYLEDISYMFYKCDIDNIKFNKVKNRNLLDLSKVKNKNNIFFPCSKFTKEWNKCHKLYRIYSTFNDLNKLNKEIIGNEPNSIYIKDEKIKDKILTEYEDLKATDNLSNLSNKKEDFQNINVKNCKNGETNNLTNILNDNNIKIYLKDNSFRVKNKEYIYEFKLYNNNFNLKYSRLIPDLDKRKATNYSKIKKENIRFG